MVWTGSLVCVRRMMRTQEIAVEIGIYVREVYDTMRHSWFVLRKPVQLGRFTPILPISGDIQRHR
jgi:hypothetical protein